MSVDGAADMVTKGHSHGDSGAAHQVNEGSLDVSLDAPGDHCERCCHANSVNMTVQAALIEMPLVGCDHLARSVAHVRNFAQAPPNPPPNT
ncbi:MAG: hypothetical protein GXP16_18840 [Gammaproteobacteria bacterium]|nr:hypothetical protein [Gammaproteobacteria bacterium]